MSPKLSHFDRTARLPNCGHKKLELRLRRQKVWMKVVATHRMDQRATQKACIDKRNHKSQDYVFILLKGCLGPTYFKSKSIKVSAIFFSLVLLWKWAPQGATPSKQGKKPLFRTDMQ